MNRPIRIASVCGATLVLLAIPLVISSSKHLSAVAKVTDVPVVSATRVVRTDLNNSTTLTAEFEPFYEVDVMAKEAGYLRHIYVDIGDSVGKGQLLATLEIPELQNNLTRAEADLQTAKAEKASAEDSLKSAEASHSIAHVSYTRILDVSKREPGLVPLQEVDVAHSRDLEAEAQIAAAQQNVFAAVSRQQAASATLAHETSLFSYSRILAPFKGVITKRYASDGAMIQAGTSSLTQALPVVKVSQNDVLRLMLPVPEEVAGTIRDGEMITVNVPSIGRTFTGKVSRFENQIQSSSRTMTAEVDVENPRHELIPGMYAEVKLSVASANNALAVPVEAVEGSGDSRHLYVVDASGVLRIRKVTVGLQTPQYIQILSGAQSGEVAVLGRQSEYSDGQQVRPRINETITTPRQ